ncbi:MAG: hypothetical protein JST20_02360 [Bacteroidetes bacterium]|nr:hypothetical protein [Bacteroidota bacterium]
MKTIQERIEHLNKLSSKLSKKYEKLEEKYEKLRKKSELLKEQAMLIDSAYQHLNSEIERTDKMAHREINVMDYPVENTEIHSKIQSFLIETNSGNSKKLGRPLGAKNKKSKKNENSKVNIEQLLPKKRGRPLGAKNKRKRKVKPEDLVAKIPKPLGRPPGSKNKKKKRLGRPIGSKNKKTILREEHNGE